MPKFTASEDEKIAAYCEARWGKPKHELPMPKFVKGKRAKSYIKDGRELYDQTVQELCRNGFPLKVAVTPENEQLHTEKFWSPLGVNCVTCLDMAGKEFVMLEKSSDQGALPLYIKDVREKKVQMRLDQGRRYVACKKIKELTDAYNQAIGELVGEAGVYEHHQPGFKFIDFDARPYKGYLNAFPSLRQDDKIDPEVFNTDVDFAPYMPSGF